MNTPESDEDSSKIDELLAELEKETLSEGSDSEKIKDKQAADTLEKLKIEKPSWADKKNDDHNDYEYIEEQPDSDEEW